MRWVATRFRILAAAATAAAIAVGCGAGGSANDGRPRGADPSYLDVTLPRIDDGGEFRLAELNGRPAVVNFFASWCVPCVIEMPDIEQVKQEFGADVEFVGINVEDSREDALDLIERTGITWDVVRDTDGELVRAVKGVGMPTTILLDTEGNIVAHHTGAISEEKLRDLIAEKLAVTPTDGSS